MANQLEEIRNSLRLFKNQLVYQYYDYRINSLQDPYQILWRNQPYKVLFILGHMRAASSLLTHILNSHPEIIGYGETHLQYNSESDLKNLMLKVYFKIQNKRLDMPHTYVLDKLLHDSKILNDKVLDSPNIYAIFLVREPARTLSSILELKSDWSHQKACHYYVQRLASLEAYAQLIDPKQSIFITHEQLINQTHEVFTALKQILSTKTNFSEEYEVLNTTGMRWIGDQSKNISAGRIVRKPKKLNEDISPELLEQAQNAYQHCCTTLSQLCTTIKQHHN
jgi:hypothetical protein